MGSQKDRKDVDIPLLEKEYGEILPILERFCDELRNQVHRIFENEDIVLGFPIQKRVKQWSSLYDKFKRFPRRFTNVKDVQDLVGIRVILLFKSDIGKTEKLISKHFKIIKRYDTQERLKEDQFGYSSVHFIIKLPIEWLSVPTFSQTGDLKAEIQVRTLSQHIWAEASHNLQYKRLESVPTSVRRAIYRVSALLETVDLELERVLEQRNVYRKDIDINSSNEVLNTDILAVILDTLLPIQNKLKDEDYANLLTDLKTFGIPDVITLTDFIKKNIGLMLAEDAKEVKYLTSSGKYVSEDDKDRVLNKGVFFGHVGLIRSALGSAENLPMTFGP